jgi:hypothetical protein
MSISKLYAGVEYYISHLILFPLMYIITQRKRGTYNGNGFKNTDNPLGKKYVYQRVK